jgi:hypothetical protein
MSTVKTAPPCERPILRTVSPHGPMLPAWLTAALARQQSEGMTRGAARPPHETASLLYEPLPPAFPGPLPIVRRNGRT